MIVSALIFAAVYVLNQSFVETNPREFALALVTILVVGMVGMMNSIISDVRPGTQKM
jgi:hypothetical protein